MALRVWSFFIFPEIVNCGYALVLLIFLPFALGACIVDSTGSVYISFQCICLVPGLWVACRSNFTLMLSFPVESQSPYGQRTAVICSKDRPTPLKYPRDPGTPAKEPL